MSQARKTEVSQARASQARESKPRASLVRASQASRVSSRLRASKGE